jgi:hypothetical protein
MMCQERSQSEFVGRCQPIQNHSVATPTNIFNKCVSGRHRRYNGMAPLFSKRGSHVQLIV